MNIILNQDGTIQAYGKITAVNSDIECNRLIASDINTSSSNTTMNGTLNISGNVFGSGTALTNLNDNAISNPLIIVKFNNAVA
jgi:hypothetical protein